MKLPLLIEAQFLKRYKRFLADVLINNELITIYCPNTGPMINCIPQKFDTIWLSLSNNPKRKYSYTWELMKNQWSNLVCIHSIYANSVCHLALTTLNNNIMSKDCRIESEIKAKNNRFDFQIQNKNNKKTYIEVKSATYQVDSQGFFPDTISKRAHKQLETMIELRAENHRCIVLYCAFNNGINHVLPATHLDPIYASLVNKAIKAGIEFWICQTHITLEAITPYALEPLNY